MDTNLASTGVATSVADVATPLAARYMTQLCKHFEHKLAVTCEATSGEIVFSSGTCRMRAEPEHLWLLLVSSDAAALTQLQDVVARHLLRFAFRAPPLIAWQPG